MAWVMFMIGMVPPISDDDALWAAAALMFGGLAAGYLLALNLLVFAVKARVRRRS